jgi:hypothetical protein
MVHNPLSPQKKKQALRLFFFAKRDENSGSSRSAAKKVGEDMERLSSKIGSQLSISFLT